MRIFYNERRERSTHPCDRRDARRMRRTLYDSQELCETCRDCTIRYTRGDACLLCSRKRALDVYNSGQVASDTYARIEPCSEQGHPGVRLIRNGKCVECEHERAHKALDRVNRETAKLEKEIWYWPSQNCPKCERMEQRRAINGSCRGCERKRKRVIPITYTGYFDMDAYPADMVVSRADARTLGMQVYRTGEECKNGHKAFRYVSTANCITCKEETIKARRRASKG